MNSQATQFSNLSVDEAARVLAVQAVIGRRQREVVKSAEWWNETMSQLGNAANSAVTNLRDSNDAGWTTARHALIGGGIGAGVGGLASLTQPREKRRSLSSMAQGALLGGVVGGGLSLAGQNLSQFSETPDSQVRARLAEIARLDRNQKAIGAPAADRATLAQEAAALRAREPGLGQDQPTDNITPFSQRAPAIVAEVASGHPISAADMALPNKSNLITTGALAGGGGFGAGVAADNAFAALENRPKNLMKTLDAGDFLDVAGKNKPLLAQKLENAARRTPRTLQQASAMRQRLKPYQKALVAKATPKAVGGWYRRGGLTAGVLSAILAAQRGKSEYLTHGQAAQE